MIKIKQMKCHTKSKSFWSRNKGRTKKCCRNWVWLESIIFIIVWSLWTRTRKLFLLTLTRSKKSKNLRKSSGRKRILISYLHIDPSFTRLLPTLLHITWKLLLNLAPLIQMQILHPIQLLAKTPWLKPLKWYLIKLKVKLKKLGSPQLIVNYL